jgi:hypothetical protein
MRTLILLAEWLVLGASASWSAPCLVDGDCADGNVCTGTERCVAGTCTPGTALNCSDNNSCTIDLCDALIGCQHAQVATTR